jgi:predicted phosphodiesterase
MRKPLKFDGKVLVFGGTYSNLAATEAMYQTAVELKISADHVICTGDLVAYCAEPQQTVAFIRKWGIHVVMGNCEESLALNQVDCGCGYESGSSCSTLADAWYAYASQAVDSASREWMGQLPRSINFSMQGYRFKVVHGSATSINQFVFASSPSRLKRDQITDAGVDAIIGGHSGIPFGQSWENKFWLNAGVIGMPANDASSDGWYMLLEPGRNSIQVSWQRLTYDAFSSQQSTRAAGMHEYAEALVSGLWPSVEVLPQAELEATGKHLDVLPLQLELN